MYHTSFLIILLAFIYEDSDSLIVYDDSLTIAGNHSYTTKVHLKNAHITITPWSGTADSTGWLALQAPSIVCQALSDIRGSGGGYWGGTTGHGDGYGPGAGGVGGISGGAGGGAGYGGAGGDGGDYYPGSGGTIYGDPSDTLINIGSGGGAGQYVSTIDGFGGNGGASLQLYGHHITIDSTDIITDGFPGEVGTIGFEGGGGGSGGGLMIRADTVLLENSILSANGGDGAGSAWGGGGGAGGGRLKVFYTDHLDTMNLVCTVSGGAGGAGYQGSDGDPGEDGTIYFEHLVDIHEHDTVEPELTIMSENPARVSIVVHCHTYPTTVRIYNATGRLVKTHLLTRSVSTVPIQDLPAGVFFLSTGHQIKNSAKITIIR